MRRRWWSAPGGRVVIAVLGAVLAGGFVAPVAVAAGPTAATAPTVEGPAIQAVYIGQRVCKYTDAWRCGTVNAVNLTVCGSMGCVYGVARATMPALVVDNGTPIQDSSTGELVGYQLAGHPLYTYFETV